MAEHVDYNPYPIQSQLLGELIEVPRFSSEGVVRNIGLIVRDDTVDPFVRLIELPDGNIVFGHEAVGFELPSQSDKNNTPVRVCFKFDYDKRIGGTIVRSDRVPPYQFVIKLINDSYLVGRECQYFLD